MWPKTVQQTKDERASDCANGEVTLTVAGVLLVDVSLDVDVSRSRADSGAMFRPPLGLTKPAC